MSDDPITVPTEGPPAWARTGVQLNPLGNEYVVGVASGRVFSDEQCAALVEAMDASAWTRGQGTDGAPASPVAAQPLPDDVAAWALPLVVKGAGLANSQHFRFDVVGLLDRDPAVVARHEEPPPAALLTDLLPARSTRKLTAVVPLSPGTGGAPVFPALGKHCADEPGVMSAFPSYLTYQLSAVEGGPRLFLWAWVHGPHFQ
jgi:hypothetical protein